MRYSLAQRQNGIQIGSGIYPLL